MKNILQNACFFAFTGTPISKRNRDTYLEFSYPPDETYLDKYFISDSIMDGFTIKIVYEPRLEKDVHLDKGMLTAYLEIEDEELPEEMRTEIKENTRRKPNTIKIILENESRIQTICKDIAGHFMENVDGKFKGMIVAASRDACITYKNELDRVLPKEYSEVVMTYQTDDSPKIQHHLKLLKERHPCQQTEEIIKTITDKFNTEEYPKLLIVTDMLLYGF
jgi:type I restriction enzyme, R subunit